MNDGRKYSCASKFLVIMGPNNIYIRGHTDTLHQVQHRTQTSFFPSGSTKLPDGLLSEIDHGYNPQNGKFDTGAQTSNQLTSTCMSDQLIQQLQMLTLFLQGSAGRGEQIYQTQIQFTYTATCGLGKKCTCIQVPRNNGKEMYFSEVRSGKKMYQCEEYLPLRYTVKCLYR